MEENESFENKTSKREEILLTILNDNKTISKELKSQLEIIEHLEEDKKKLLNELRDIRREAKLCVDREKLIARRNAALALQLKQKTKELSEEKASTAALRKNMEWQMAKVRSTYEEQIENMEWSNEKLGIDIVVKDAKLHKMQDDRNRLRKMVMLKVRKV